ncbi:MAG: YegP family protein, partial [Clostridia bacterium]|nr:YegP family protein [Clostridia bacterium]
RTDSDNFVFKLFSYNKRVVVTATDKYSSLGACKNGIQSIINNSATAPIEDQTLKKIVPQKCPKWIIFMDKRGEFRLRLIASNGEMVAQTNDGYLSKDAAKKGIEAIARAAKGADIVRNDDLL